MWRMSGCINVVVAHSCYIGDQWAMQLIFVVESLSPWWIRQLTHYPVNTKHLYNICTMSDKRRRCWPLGWCCTNIRASFLAQLVGYSHQCRVKISYLPVLVDGFTQAQGSSSDGAPLDQLQRWLAHCWACNDWAAAHIDRVFTFWHQ